MDSNNEHTTFRSLNLGGWRQFQRVSIDFHPHLTVITGANGSGKTALLRLLARHCNWWFDELSTPVRDTLGALFFSLALAPSFDLTRLLLDDATDVDERKRIHQALAGIEAYWESVSSPGEWREPLENYIQIGLVSYGDGTKNAQILAPRYVESATYQPSIAPYVSVAGIFVPSHRTLFVYRPVRTIPLEPLSAETTLERFLDAVRSRALHQVGQNSEPASYYMKEALLSWAILGYGNEVVTPDREKIEFFQSFEQVMTLVLPPTLKFQHLEIRAPEIVLVCDGSEFMLDAVSGGIAAILELAWQIFVRDPRRKARFCVIIDEVENHLHASMQRTLLPSLISAFPNVQFIVSTHSPLVVGSVRDSNVVALRYDAEGKVFSERLDLSERAGTATEILREVLGVPVTSPVWVEELLQTIASKFEKHALTGDTFNELRSDLKSVGLEEFAPQAISDLVAQRHRS